MKTRFRMHLTAGSAASARHLVTRALALWRLPRCGDDPLLADALIVVTELVENVDRHTDAEGDLILWLRPGAILIEVRDTSPQLPVLRDHDHRRANGRGLRMIDTIASRWGTRPTPGGKVVWAELRTT